jgi:Na+-driven multidrug efflux pump
MSVVGVALATVISNGICAGLVLWFLVREQGPFRLEFRKLRLHREDLLDILRIGLPSGLQGTVFSVSNVCIQTAVNGFGSAVIAGSAVGVTFEFISYFALNGFVQACLNFTGQNYGAKNFDNIKKILIHCILITMIGSVLIGYICASYGHHLLYLFTNEQTVIEAGIYRLRYVTFFLFLNGILDVIVGSMRGMGYSTIPTAITMIGIVGIRLSYIFLVFAKTGTLQSLYLCFPISWLITSVIQLCLWHHIYTTQKT